MSTWTSDQVNQIISIQGQPVAGLGGAPSLPRATEIRGIIKVHRFTIELDAPNPMPGVEGGSLAIGDSFIIALLNPTDRIYFGKVFGANPNSDGSFLVTVGKFDPNIDTSFLEWYLSSAFPTFITNGAEFNTNMTEQVGSDPQGDLSEGNEVPGFGAEKVQIILTIGGVNGETIGTGVSLFGYIFVVEEGN